MEVAIIRLTAAISFPGIKLKPAKAREVASDDRVACGGVDALSAIYDHHAAALYRLLVAMLGNSEDAEDVLQEIFVKLRHKIAFARCGFASLSLSYARNEAINMLRRRQREQRLMESCIEENIPSTTNTPSGVNHDWQKLLARLPLEQREIVALKIWEEMTFAEIAAVVKTSPNTAASRYRYGIERLRKLYEEENADEQ